MRMIMIVVMFEQCTLWISLLRFLQLPWMMMMMIDRMMHMMIMVRKRIMKKMRMVKLTSAHLVNPYVKVILLLQVFKSNSRVDILKN